MSQVIQDAFLIRDTCQALLRQDVESRSRVVVVEAKAKVLVDQLLALEAQVKELEVELKRTWDSIIDFELLMEDREAELTQRVKYIKPTWRRALSCPPPLHSTRRASYRTSKCG